MVNEDLKQGFLRALPIVLGYLPLGFAFGVLASQVGLSPFAVFLMSLLVFAGSAQFIAISLLTTGSNILTIIGTTFLVNLRHLLFSAALSPHLKSFSKPVLAAIGFEITDESFAVAISNYQKNAASASFQFGLNTTAHFAWIVSTVLGSIGGNLIGNPEILGLNFALPAMFIGLLMMQLKDLLTVIVAIAAGILSVVFYFLLPANWNVLLATVSAATLGVLFEKWLKIP